MASESSKYRVDPLYIKMTTPRDMGRSSLTSVRDLFGGLSQTSQFKVTMYLGANSNANTTDTQLIKHLTRSGVLGRDSAQGFNYDFFCSEATLPGSTFDMGEESGSRQGIIERFPTKRIFSEFDLTFYVDSNYNVVRLFEEWMNFIDPLTDQAGTYNGLPGAQVGFQDRPAFYRFRYPNSYKRLVAITKFERDFLPNPNVDSGGIYNDPPMLTYQFIDAFPTNLTALPLSYEGTTITKTTINFSYTRYITLKHGGGVNTTRRVTTKSPGNPELSQEDLDSTINRSTLARAAEANPSLTYNQYRASFEGEDIINAQNAINTPITGNK